MTQSATHARARIGFEAKNRNTGYLGLNEIIESMIWKQNWEVENMKKCLNEVIESEMEMETKL